MFNLSKYEYYEDINLGVLKHRPDGKKILDVGCGNGLMGSLYKQKNNKYFGIDIAYDMKNVAGKRLDKFYNSDVTDYKKITKLLGKEKFDMIIFADVLEHLADPVAVVNFYKNFLKKEGEICISVPNIAVFYTRIGLLLGKFNYGPCGILDKTHLRFFTKNNLLRLGKDTDLELVSLDVTPGIARFIQYVLRDIVKSSNKQNRRGWIDTPIYKFYTKFVYYPEYLFCKLWPGLLAYQYVGIFKRKS